MDATPNNSLGFKKVQAKITSHFAQSKMVFLYLKNHLATASMVSEATGVPQKCICRYKRDFEKAGVLWEVEKKLCKATGFGAWYLTTDPEKAPKHPKQYKLF